ncbi:putative acyltransferase [Bernardetia litoralis DSM 6794]|uniref:Putative acyltransferase n=1 Tax=Bernardetia litoralis (strain ATCC 23117 / DSM 6794 / NBRC 15988 / NCIMB 1366 / Fx l1 / Sio-4) TaxID=880071 RepID=I4ANZ9_BERLS|nr:acyltransferase [Bernardetia litoralis]AFM05684.1 putative acyltransferase [Bernardetia litoralis DSM 6794]
MKNPVIDTVKGLAIIGVLFAHMNFTGRFDDSTLEFINTIQLIFGWCVIAFFFCSGLVAKSITTQLEFKKFIKKRFQRLVIPCIIFSLTYKLLMSIIYLTGLFSWSSPLPTNFQETIYFIFYPVSPQFYFLYYLFAISICVQILELIISRFIIFWIALVGFIISCFLMDIPLQSYGPEFNLLPAYILGYVFGFAISQFNQNTKTIIIIYYSSFYSTLIFLAFFFSNNNLFFQFITLVSLWLIIEYIPVLSKIFNKTKLGKYSSSIYVWHAPLLMPFLSILFVKTLGGGGIILFPILLGTIFISIFLSKITMRYEWLRFWRF